MFLVALLAWPVARRLRDTEATVRRQQVDLANLAQLSQYIVQHLRESIVVIDHENRIRLINESAAKLLGDSRAYPGALLGEASPQLLYLLETWRARTTTPAAPSHTFVAADGGHVIQPHFASLGGTEPAPVIVFLEDTELLAAKIQQSKLAGLGRLSASIAHEIRNPVGRHEPRRAAAGRVRRRCPPKTSASPRSCAPTATACARSSKTSCRWRAAKARGPSA